VSWKCFFFTKQNVISKDFFAQKPRVEASGYLKTSWSTVSAGSSKNRYFAWSGLGAHKLSFSRGNQMRVLVRIRSGISFRWYSVATNSDYSMVWKRISTLTSECDGFVQWKLYSWSLSVFIAVFYSVSLISQQFLCKHCFAIPPSHPLCAHTWARPAMCTRTHTLAHLHIPNAETAPEIYPLHPNNESWAKNKTATVIMLRTKKNKKTPSIEKEANWIAQTLVVRLRKRPPDRFDYFIFVFFSSCSIVHH
jgi:hypothetical protein